MPVKELIDQIGGRERLEEIAADGFLKHGESKLMARALLAVPDAQEKPVLTVWYGSMPESNGKENWTAILITKGGNLHDGMTIDRSEYPGRVLWAADRVRWLIGEREDRPCLTDYDHLKRSSYVYPTPPAHSVPDGYCLRLIPADGTEAFRAACTVAFEEFNRGTGPCGVFIAGHRAMLAAAPAPGGDGGDQS